jgi:hypothetical protein
VTALAVVALGAITVLNVLLAGRLLSARRSAAVLPMPYALVGVCCYAELPTGDRVAYDVMIVVHNPAEGESGSRLSVVPLDQVTGGPPAVPSGSVLVVEWGPDAEPMTMDVE